MRTPRTSRRPWVRSSLRILLGVIVLAAMSLGLLWIVVKPPALAVPRQTGLVLSNVTVVNPGLDRREHQTLTLRGSRIVSIVDADERPREAGPFSGAFVLPGLIDMHVHYPPAIAVGQIELFSLLFLAHGVTTVRECGSIDGTILRTRHRTANGAFAGPRIFACGPILDGDPPFWPGARVVHDAHEGHEAVEDLARAGVDCIKVYENLSGDALAAARAAAAEHRLPVIGHVPQRVSFEASGLAEVEHFEGIVHRKALVRDLADLVAANVEAWRGVDSAEMDRIVRVSINQQIAHTPTLVSLEHNSHAYNYLGQLAGPTPRLLPRFWRDVVWNPLYQPRFRNLSRDDWEGFGEVAVKVKALVRRHHEAGAMVFVGTDTGSNPFVVPGASLYEELHHFVKTGFRPEEAWAAATRLPGATLPEAMLGTLREGAPADLLVFRRDPTRDLAALSTLEAVISQGRYYPKRLLDQALVRSREHFDAPLYDFVTMRLARLVSARFLEQHR